MNNNSDNKNSKNNIEKPDTVNMEEANHSFIVEKINERPINKKRLVRKMLITAGMAFVFGTIACISFLVLEPLFDKMITRGGKDETVLTQVTLTEAPEDEVLEYEAIINDSPFDENVDGQDVIDIIDENYPEIIGIEETPIENLNLEDNVSENDVTENIVIKEEKKDLELDDYQMLYRKMYGMSKEVSKSIVTVTSAGKSQDIFNDEFVNTGRTTGLIVAETDNELLILADSSELPNGNIMVTFCDGQIVSASEKVIDKETGLAVYAVSAYSISQTTKDAITIATLGSSKATSILGTPVIAIGDPLNTGNSICYGAVTSNKSTVYVTDASYELLNTDIYASKKGNGILVNVRGQVIGIICQHNNSDDMKNLVTAYGISGIKNLIEDMSNNNEKVYVGLHLKDITSEALISLNIPSGVYVQKVEIDSPAMNVGIVQGDIICAVNGKEISSVNDYSNALRNSDNAENAMLTIMRLNGNEYKESVIEVKLENK